MKKYERVTPIGYNTGKVIVGCCYIPKAKQMTENEAFIQRIVRGRGLPPERMAHDVWLKIKSMLRRTTSL
jgi:hypothetical protein